MRHEITINTEYLDSKLKQYDYMTFNLLGIETMLGVVCVAMETKEGCGSMEHDVLHAALKIIRRVREEIIPQQQAAEAAAANTQQAPAAAESGEPCR